MAIPEGVVFSYQETPDGEQPKSGEEVICRRFAGDCLAETARF
jgi:hypothetical protein